MSKRRRIALDWEVGWHREADARPQRWVPATVPGAVQLDWARAEGWGDWWYGDNFRAYAWMEDVYWTYRARLPALPRGPGETLWFCADGVDYQCEIFFNGRKLHEQEGMFTPIEFRLPTRLRIGDELAIRIHPAPKSRPAPADRVQANRSCKPAVSYGWDFHPRLIPLGLWRNAWVELWPKRCIGDANWWQCGLSDDFSEGLVEVGVVPFGKASAVVRARLLDPDGRVVATSEEAVPPPIRGWSDGNFLPFRVNHPQLWWPHDQGRPALYTVETELLDESGEVLDVARRRFGFRRVRLVMHPGAWEKPDGFPKSRSNPPITLEINGRRVFAKGSNWVSPDVFPGTLTRERYREQLTLVRDANMNLLRCWGGAIVQKDAFFDLCDELGIMVWQEFPLACNDYANSGGYLGTLDQESQSIIKRLKHHPSLVLWCGGNELYNSWSGMTDQSHALRLLNRNTYDLDRERPFLPTSPVMGMGHGHYCFRDQGRKAECWEFFQRAACTAYTEFGVPGPAPVAVLDRFLPAGERFPPRPGGTWEAHHAFGAWMANSHLCLDIIEYYFGASATLEELVAKGQLLQGEGLRGLFEEVRRQQPRAAMALNWCLNEPWPTAANCSLIAWPCVPKPALVTVAAACRPVLVSAKIAHYLWRAGETFGVELWRLNDSPAALPAGRVAASVVIGAQEFALPAWDCAAQPAATNQRGPAVQFALPAVGGADRLELRLRAAGQPGWDSTYVLAYRPTPA